VTVVLAIALAVIGVVLAWPVDALLPVLDPLEPYLAQLGLGLAFDQQTGFICLLLSPALLVAGSLLPQI
jgi:hypothetical protein